MDEKIVVIGMGEIGSVFARGFLKLGYPVYPVTRSTDLAAAVEKNPNPFLVVVAVGEKDIHHTIETLPGAWRNNVVLLQNELLPRDWQGQLENPTVISVWFEKKKGMDSKVVVPSPIYGPNARLLKNALATLDIPSYDLTSSDELQFELVRKNVYILTSNIAGLITGGTVSELWANHQQLARDVVTDVLKIQEKLTGQTLEAEPYIQGMLTSFEGDPEHKCMGRSAPQRLARALQQSQQFGLDVPTLTMIQSKH